MTPAATPRPWHVETVPTQVGHCHKIMPIGACLYVDGFTNDEDSEKARIGKANAALIVSAVNAFDDLKDACIGGLAFVVAMGTCGVSVEDTTKMLGFFRAALRKAGVPSCR